MSLTPFPHPTRAPATLSAMRRFASLLLVFATLAQIASAASLAVDPLQQDFDRIAQGYPGRVGVCALSETASACVNADEPFALQSVMKLLASLAVMDAVDTKGWHLAEPITLHKEDLSLYVQPVAKLVLEKGTYTTTLGDLIRRAIVDSDSAAVDVLVARLGGPKVVQSFLDRKQIRGVRFDRDEKHLQTEIVGLQWKPEFLNPPALDEAIKRIPKNIRDTAEARYRRDPRDTATPMGMAMLLQALTRNKLLTPASSRYIIDIMKQTVTGPNRLKAGTASGWDLAHKTGTSGTWNGITTAMNDVGILFAPNGSAIPIAVLLGDSKASDEQAGALMAKLAAATIARYQ
jgi:beta-lactamase class A